MVTGRNSNSLYFKLTSWRKMDQPILCFKPCFDVPNLIYPRFRNFDSKNILLKLI